ncbi:hypothetical protein AYK20_05060 [Thermoplasmatales archaeon SG8-52-1]|nr:MAG: hypothetical protein AYK20_05060 [Thermoplasmatales archaeon SG8-52-1]
MIIPGYIIGISCLLLVTYRTFIAFFSESKSVLVNINRFGEQYLDLFALVVIWIITLIGLIILIFMLKEEREIRNGNYNDDLSFFKISDSSKDIESDMIIKIDKGEIKGLIADPVNFDE